MKEFIEKAFGIKDSELEGWEYNIPEGYTASIENGKIIVKKEESEDEKIRKELIHLVKKSNEYGGYALHKWEADRMLAWLEKQGESKFEQCIQEGDKIVTNEDGTHFNVSQLERVAKKATETEETAKEFLKSAEIMDENGKLADEYRLEKQGEQKSADKVEPKFEIEEGKWYVCIKDLLDNYANKAFRKGDIYLSTQNGSLIPSNSNVPFEVVCPDTYFKDWTIQDAKDGDVLAFDNDNIVIFKDLYNHTSFHSYCHIEDGIFDFSTDELPDWWEDEGFKPATKEQCDLLFQKMKKAGYEWDDKKKELGKRVITLEQSKKLIELGEWIKNN